MPLHDHFHAPLADERHWEGFHSLWASMLVIRLSQRLPPRYYAEPHVRLGMQVEVDVATFEDEAPVRSEPQTGNGATTAVWAPPRPLQSLAVTLPAQDTFEVRVYDARRASRLVAAVELVSPANKDRPDHRRAFLEKCLAYLQQRVAVVIVDIVTDRHAHLHNELLQCLDLAVQEPPMPGPPLYAVSYRVTKLAGQWRLETWPEALALGQQLPTLPLWLADDLAVPLELEPSYEETCRVLRIR
jgi:Protein of unknown function (DUF4058)